MERIKGNFFEITRKRAISLMLVLLMVASMLPTMWPSVKAADVECELEEHAHADGCYELGCTLSEEEGGHIHDDGCYTLVCTETEHVHSQECEGSQEEAAPVEETDDDEISLFAEGTELSVSGVWDVGDSAQGHENIAFGSSAAATIEHGDDYQSEDVAVRVTVNYPDGASDRKLKIELAEGLEWVSNGESSILASALASVSSQQGKSKIYGHTMNNGYYTYSFNEGVAAVSVTIRVKKSVATNFPSITDAIKVTATCTENGETVSASSSLKNLQCEQFSHIGHITTRIEKTVKAGEIAYNHGFVLTSYDNNNLISHDRLYDYAEITVTVPKGVTLLSTDVNHSGSGGIADIVTPGWYLKSTDDSAADVTKYTVRAEKIYSVSIGSTFEWVFPESFVGQKVLLKYSDMTWKLYGDDTVYSMPSNIAREVYYNVVPANTVNEIVEGDTIVAQFCEDTCSPDGVYKMGGFVIRNKGTDDSVPKIVEYNFDEKLGVTNVALSVVGKGTTTVKVWYKVQGDDTWYEKDVTKKLETNMSETLLARIDITNLDLGLSADTYLSAIKYEYDFLADDNGTPDDTSDDIRTGIPAGKSTIGFSNNSVNTGGHNPFAGVNLGLSASNPTAVSTVTIRDKYDDGTNEPLTYTVTTKYNPKPESYMYAIGREVLDKKAGDRFTVSAQISANWAAQSSKPYSVGFTQYPIIYIRDETGEGISDIKLKNLDGVDIIAKYPNNISVTLDHTETVDHNGDGKFAKVYKIDTTGLSSMTAKEDRYAAAVGFWDTTATKYKLELSYTVYTPGTYDDGSAVHKLSEAIFLSDPLMASRSKKANGEKADPYDVDNDGVVAGDKDIFQSSNQDSVLAAEYTIAPSADISVAAAVKKASDGGSYTTWDGSDDYVQIQSGDVYNVRNSVYNGSGVTTSTEAGKRTVIYIPIPKEGQQWGTAGRGIDKNGNESAAFAYDMELSGAVDNPDEDVFTIHYGTVDTSGFGKNDNPQMLGTALNGSSTSWSSSYSDTTNCVRIIVSGMEPSEAISEAEDFILPLKADENAENRETNIFSAIYYEDITNINGDIFKIWKYSDKLALQIAEGEISGRIWIDANGNGLQDEEEKGAAGIDVTLVGEGGNLTAVTDSKGEYKFTKLDLGEYYITFTPGSDDYTLSKKDVGSNDSMDSDAAADGTAAKITGIVIPDTDSLGKQTFAFGNLDAGLVPYVNIDYTWDGDIPSGAVLPGSDKVTAGIKYTADAIANVIGYTFEGWFIDAALTEKFVDNTAVTEDTTLHGKWTVHEYTVSYSFVGEAPDGAEAPEDDTVDHGTAYTAENSADVEGYLFDGWYTDESCTSEFADGTAITADTDLYGKWIENRVKVSGSVAWENVPNGLSVPSLTVELVLDGEVVDSVTLSNAETEYSFSDLDKYASAGSEPLEYAVQVKPVENYETEIGDAVVDAKGNSVIDIVNRGTFTYSTLTLSNKVSGEDAPADAQFTYTVTFDNEAVYTYEGSYTGTIKSGDKITLKGGESITIADAVVGTKFEIVQDKVENFVTVPSSGKIEGVISSTASVAEFTNNFKLPPVGNLEISNKVVGDGADKTLKFPFKVEFDAEGSYEYKIISDTAAASYSMRAANPTIDSGDTIELAHGETAVIYGLPAGVAYKVTETDQKGYKLTSTGALGTVAEEGSKASFINEKNGIVAGDSSSNPETGDDNTTVTAAVFLMQAAAMAMTACFLYMRKLRREEDSERL
ncbi:MAG: InlB B-repeat-containing protein [Clostridia bacterium]|nr:InlB B-repeat-containing protein [Clostridia bacterium]